MGQMRSGWVAWEVRRDGESRCLCSRWSVAKEARGLATMGRGGGTQEAGWVAVGAARRRRPCRRVTARPGDEGRVGRWTTVAMLDRDGRSVATSVAKEAVATEGRDVAW